MSDFGRDVIKGLKDGLKAIRNDTPMRVTEYKKIGDKLVRKVSMKRPSELVKKARKRKWA